MKLHALCSLFALQMLAACSDPNARTMSDVTVGSDVDATELSALLSLLDRAQVSPGSVRVYRDLSQFPMPHTGLYGDDLFASVGVQNDLPTGSTDDDAAVISGGHIVALRLSHLGISQLVELQSLTALRALDLHRDALMELPNLAPLVHLEFIDVSANRLSTIPGVDELTDLRVLYAAGNAISKLEPRLRSTHLENINLAWNTIPRMDEFDGLSNLKVLSLEGNPIDKIEGLQRTLELRYLNLSFCRIARIEGVSQLQKLEHLDLTHNQISSLNGIENMPNLVYLSLGENPYPLGDPKAQDDLRRLGFLKFFYIL